MSLHRRIERLERVSGPSWVTEALRAVDGKTRGLPVNRPASPGPGLCRDGGETYWTAKGKRIAWSSLEGMTLVQAESAVTAALQ